MLEVRAVSRGRGGRTVLSGASFHVVPGRPTVILAPSAAARAALLRMLAGLDPPDAGAVRFKGEDASRSRMLRRSTLWVRKFGCASTSAKVRSVLLSAAREAGLKGREAEDAAIRAAGSAGLSADLDTPVKRLDVERCIRVALAQAAARKPVMLVLDDILSALEAPARARLLADLATMLSDTGEVMVVYATALPEEARIIGGSIIVIEDGRVVQAGATGDVLDHPADLVSAQATTRPRLNTLVVMSGEAGRKLADGTGFSPPPGVDLPTGTRCTLAFRPTDARTNRESDGCVRFLVRGVGAETVGEQRLARVAFAGETWLVGLPPSGDPAPGLMLNVFVDRDRLMVFGEDGLAWRG